VTHRDQVVGGHIGALLIVNRQGIELLMKSVNKYNRSPKMSKLMREGIGHPHREEEKPVDAASHHVVTERAFNLIRVVDTEEENVAIELTEF
jgi:hypothetical protein